jgi:glyceraldehyde 3-phosphate dehydrogenase
VGAEVSLRVGINGFGRIGRVFVRVLLARHDGAASSVVAVNDPAGDAETMAFLLGHDSVYGPLSNRVEPTETGLAVDGRPIRLLEESDPNRAPWADYGVDVVIEASGRFTHRRQAEAHLGGSVRWVVISAPSDDADVTVCVGVNDAELDPARHAVISNASCTTNCLAPMARVLEERFGIDHGFMSTVHAYTTGQGLLDAARVGRSGKRDLRRMRAAGVSIVPTTTGATRAVGRVLPGLAGRLDGLALRVPVPDGSLVDLVAKLRQPASVQDVNDAFRAAADAPSYRGVLVYTDQLLVSADIVGHPESCLFSAGDTMAHGESVKILGWYDNEWGYASRLADLVGLLSAG